MCAAGRTPVPHRLIDAYITGLRQRLPTLCIRRLDHLPGATEGQLLRLRREHPAAPPELLYLLQRVNGTYWEAIRAGDGSSGSGGGGPAVSSAPSPSSVAAAAAAAAAAVVTPSSSSSNDVSSSSVSSGSGMSNTAAAAAAVVAPSPATGGGSGSSTSVEGQAGAWPQHHHTAREAAKSFLQSTLSGPRRRRVNAERIAVPILGSALTACPYYLKTVEDILEPFGQPFPPKRKSAPRAPTDEDFFAVREGSREWGGRPPPSDTTTTTTTIDKMDDTTATTSSSSCPSSPTRNRHCPTGRSTIAAIYAGHAIARVPPPPEVVNPSTYTSVLQYLFSRSNRQQERDQLHSLASGASGVGGVTLDITGGGRSDPAVMATAAAAATAATTCSTAAAGRRKVVYVDPKINIDADFSQWLAFADSMLPHHQPWGDEDEDGTVVDAVAAADLESSAAAVVTARSHSHHIHHHHASGSNAGVPPRKASVSRLYVDFSPDALQGGTCGQIIQYSRGEPESFAVIAPSFRDYIKLLMSEEYGFTEELEDGDDDDDDDDDKDDDKNKDKGDSKDADLIILSPSDRNDDRGGRDDDDDGARIKVGEDGRAAGAESVLVSPSGLPILSHTNGGQS